MVRPPLPFEYTEIKVEKDNVYLQGPGKTADNMRHK